MNRSQYLGLAFAFFLSACGGDGGTGPDDNGMNGGGGGGEARVVKDDPSFASDIQEIFNRNGCSAGVCHGSSAQAGLDLRTGNSYGNLVEVTATQADMFRVTPGDPTNSYLIRKVEGTASFGEQMPLGGTPLDAIDLANLRNWISSGASNN